MNKSLHAILVKTCTSRTDPLFHGCYDGDITETHCLIVLTSTVWSPSTLSKYQWMSVGTIFYFCLLHGGIQWHNFPSSTLPCQMLFWQTAPLPLSVTWKQHVMGYWREDSTSIAMWPTPTSGVVGPHNKMGDITFEGALVTVTPCVLLSLKQLIYSKAFPKHTLQSWFSLILH